MLLLLLVTIFLFTKQRVKNNQRLLFSLRPDRKEERKQYINKLKEAKVLEL